MRAGLLNLSHLYFKDGTWTGVIVYGVSTQNKASISMYELISQYFIQIQPAITAK